MISAWILKFQRTSLLPEIIQSAKTVRNILPISGTIAVLKLSVRSPPTRSNRPCQIYKKHRSTQHWQTKSRFTHRAWKAGVVCIVEKDKPGGGRKRGCKNTPRTEANEGQKGGGGAGGVRGKRESNVGRSIYRPPRLLERDNCVGVKLQSRTQLVATGFDSSPSTGVQGVGT